MLVRLKILSALVAITISGALFANMPANAQNDAADVSATAHAGSSKGTDYHIVPASPGDADAYKLMPDGTNGFELVPASPSDTNVYKLIPAATATTTPAPDEPALQKFFVGGQTTTIAQHVWPFHSPYAGPQSFLSRNETEATNTETVYVGYRLNDRLEGYVAPEEARGHGLSQGYGLGSFTNGEIVRTPTLDHELYFARYFLRWVVPTGKGTESVDQDELQLAGIRPTHRIVITGGGLAVSDLFDVNRYANDGRTQFMSWGLINDAAYDYAADTHGYTKGLVAEWINPDFAARFGAFQMPTVANGIDLSGNYKDNAGYNVEMESHPRFMASQAGQGIVRLTYMRNLAHMGSYRDAVAVGNETGTPPDITSVETTGAHKYGYYINFEQPLANGGDTGIFGRAGFNDGQTEDYVYTEADRHVSFGGQLSGVRWHRQDDVLALALMQNDLSSAHAAYLANGGLGFLLGDGKLDYAPERTLESYYNYNLSRHSAATAIFVSPDYQYVCDPGYNKDRGPVSVASMRLHIEF